MDLTRVSRGHLALFARFPSPGKCKTRLIPCLGADGACSFALASLTDIMHLLATTASHKTLFYTPATAEPEVSLFLQQESLSASWAMHPQLENAPDLGARLHGALEHLQTRTWRRDADVDVLSSPIVPVTFIGMDCFDLSPAVIEDSMAQVASTSGMAHMIPACDGGYVLLTVPLGCDGCRVFERIPWSCDRTGRVQIQRLEEAGLSCALGRALPDVDEPDDLEKLWQARELKRGAHPRTIAFLETAMRSGLGGANGFLMTFLTKASLYTYIGEEPTDCDVDCG